MIALCFAAAIAGLSIAQSAHAQEAQKRSITEKDIFQFNWIGDPQISPDGSRVAFVKVTVNEKKDGYDTSIWSVGTRGNEAPVNQPPERTASVGLNPFRQPGTCRIALIDGPTRLQAAGQRASVACCNDPRQCGLDGVPCRACQSGI